MCRKRKRKTISSGVLLEIRFINCPAIESLSQVDQRSEVTWVIYCFAATNNEEESERSSCQTEWVICGLHALITEGWFNQPPVLAFLTHAMFSNEVTNLPPRAHPFILMCLSMMFLYIIIYYILSTFIIEYWHHFTSHSYN